MYTIKIYSKEQGVSIIDGELVKDPNRKYLGHLNLFLKEDSNSDEGGVKIQSSLVFSDYPHNKEYFYEMDQQIHPDILDRIIDGLIKNLKTYKGNETANQYLIILQGAFKK